MNFKILKSLISRNIFGYCCPNCLKNDITKTFTAKLYCIPKKKNTLNFDGYYIQCRYCKLATNMFETVEDAEKDWASKF